MTTTSPAVGMEFDDHVRVEFQLDERRAVIVAAWAKKEQDSNKKVTTDLRQE
jgi:hypothetical protein